MADPKPIRVKITLELDEADIELLISAIRTSITTRGLGRMLGDKLVPKLMPKIAPPTPKADEREKRLLELLCNAIGH